jgi:hypothetical protein
MNEEMSRIRILDRMSDEIVLYESDHYVCIMKLFPMCRYDGTIARDDYRRFHLRFYIPREYLTDGYKKIEEIVVMTNGLDEFSHYTLYDELGSRFASKGLPAVLLPLPDHLHRHTRYRISKPDAKQLTDKPSQLMMSTPIRLYERFLQFKDELAQLRNHVTNVGCQQRTGPCSFYSNLFAPRVRISYLGYSLGAAALLSDYLESEADLNACFLLNGAIKLRDIISEQLFPQSIWDEFIRKLEEDYRARVDRNRFFEEIFLGHYVNYSRDLLEKHGHRVLFIYGGRDSLTSYKILETITPKKWGSGLLVLPGINHFLGIDEQWKKWIGLVVNLILEFNENAVRQTITKEELHRQYMKLQEGMDDLSAADRESIESQLYRASLMGIHPELDVAADAHRAEIKKITSSTRFEELQLGMMLYQAGMITAEQLSKGLEEHQKSKKKIGDVFVDVLELVPRDHVEALASVQIKAVGSI